MNKNPYASSTCDRSLNMWYKIRCDESSKKDSILGNSRKQSDLSTFTFSGVPLNLCLCLAFVAILCNNSVILCCSFPATLVWKSQTSQAELLVSTIVGHSTAAVEGWMIECIKALAFAYIHMCLSPTSIPLTPKARLMCIVLVMPYE